jgi:hypothetical protein
MSDMRNELHIKFGEELKIQAFRLHCLENGISDGVVYEDGVAFPMNEYANFGKHYPETLNENVRLIGAIIKLQSAKRKREINNDRSRD